MDRVTYTGSNTDSEGDRNWNTGVRIDTKNGVAKEYESEG